MNKNLFITFEGIDGCGKDTQLNKLVEQIREDDNFPFGDKYSSVWITREPTKLTDQGKLISQKIREQDVSKEEATKLYIEDRIQHSKLIKEILSHSHVCCSRYDLSTLSYQMTQGMDFDYLYELHKYGQFNGTLIPDITIIFLIDEEIANKRINSRNGITECFEKREFQKKLVDNLNFCIEKLEKKGRIIIQVNANQPIEEVSKEMFEKIYSYLNS